VYRSRERQVVRGGFHESALAECSTWLTFATWQESVAEAAVGTIVSSFTKYCRYPSVLGLPGQTTMRGTLMPWGTLPLLLGPDKHVRDQQLLRRIRQML